MSCTVFLPPMRSRRWCAWACVMVTTLASLGWVVARDAIAQTSETPDAPVVLIVVGAGGAPEYEAMFREWAEGWRNAAERGGAAVTVVGLESSLEGTEKQTTDRERLERLVKEVVAKSSPHPCWLVLLGHGTFDGKTAKFNLRGPDVSASDLREWLTGARRPLLILNCSSSSGPFLAALSGRERVVITATRSGAEQNFSRFGGYLAEAIANLASDLDKDGQVSLLEAYITASRRTAAFYEEEGRLATEHALLDDNGDGLGTPGDWYRGIHAIRAARDGAALDGPFAHRWHLISGESDKDLSPEVLAKSRALEEAIESLRQRKAAMAEADYYRQLESLLVELARLLQEEPASVRP